MDNNGRLIQIIENLIDAVEMVPNVRLKIHQLIKNFNQFNSYFNNGISISQKSLYNTIDDLKCVDYDMDILWL